MTGTTEHAGPARRRDAVRVVLIDPKDRVLLISGSDPTDPTGARWWHVPGGGIEPGESPESAAIRETAEETGLRLASVGPVIWRRRAEFFLMGERIEQHEVYFALAVATFAPAVSGWTDLERRWMGEFRWWSLADLAGTAETVYPEGLGELVAGWRLGGLVTRPVTG
jgi:8-oxo-dGTP pyrophosphatase MutT (NUDIX family)